MDANTVIAVSATTIALGSLGVSVWEGRAARRHNRQSVVPALQLWFVRRDDWAGLRMINCGLGPAVITGSVFVLDGEVVGQWDEATVDGMRADLPLRPKALVLRKGRIFPAGYDGYLLRLDGDNDSVQGWFWDLLRDRMRIEIHYESVYGDRYTVSTDSVP